MEIKKGFNKIAQQYDNQRNKLIPCFDDFYKCAVDNLELNSSTPCILDLGAGTGLLTEKVLEKYPKAKVDLIDLSDNMLEVAKERFANNNNISVQVADYSVCNFGNIYDAIISSLSIHHLEDQAKVSLYEKIYAHIVSEGIFINAEQVLGETAFIENIYRQFWEKDVEQSGLKKEEILSAYERVKLDKRTPLSVQLNWLKDIGFKDVTCLYKNYSFAVFYARK